MLQIEIIEKAKELWPKSTPAELSLLTKIFSNLDGQRAIDILEDARINSRYATIPFKEIQRRARVLCSKSGLSGSYIECWAVHQETKKFYNCCVLAQTDEGARMMMISYLQHRCHVEPTDYTLFIGKESHQGFWDYQHGNININPDDEF